MIIPNQRHDRKKKLGHRTQENKDGIGSNAIDKGNSHDSNKGAKYNKNVLKDLIGQNFAEKTRYKSISSADVPGSTRGTTKDAYYYTRVKNKNEQQHDQSSQDNYSLMREDELDGLEPLEDIQQRPNNNGFPFGSKATSNLQKNPHLIVCWCIIIISSYVLL